MLLIAQIPGYIAHKFQGSEQYKFNPLCALQSQSNELGIQYFTLDE